MHHGIIKLLNQIFYIWMHLWRKKNLLIKLMLIKIVQIGVELQEIQWLDIFIIKKDFKIHKLLNNIKMKECFFKIKF